MIKLRSRAPYTCRFTTAGRPCAAYLEEGDGEICTTHAQAVQRFELGPAKQPEKELVVAVRRIWP